MGQKKMSVGKKTKAKVETLTESVGLLHKHLQELQGLAEECTPPEYQAILKAEQLYFALNSEVLRVLYAVKGRKRGYSMEASKEILGEI
jgi:hypothetical protein